MIQANEYVAFSYEDPEGEKPQWNRYVPITDENKDYAIKLMNYVTEEGWQMYDAKIEYLTDGEMMQKIIDDPLVTVSHIDTNVFKKIEEHANNRPAGYEYAIDDVEYYDDNENLLPLHKYYASGDVFLENISTEDFFKIIQSR